LTDPKGLSPLGLRLNNPTTKMPNRILEHKA